jgi:DNA-binding NarL/FixJ family response regulator
MRTIKVLLADDHHLIRDGIKMMLAKADNVEIVGEASSGVEAINYVAKNSGNVDLILMDINMPEMNGIDATQILSEKYPHIKVLAFTMHEEEEYITKMIKAGESGYVLKSSGKEELIEAIERVSLGNKHYSNEVSVTMINSMMSDEKINKINLSEREIEVLSHIAQGSTSKEAGEKLFISNRTVESHRRNILSKLDIRSTAEMIAYALKNKLIT